MNEMTFNIETSISDVQNTMERTLIRVPPVLQEKTVDANHVSVQADSGYEGLSQVNINWHPNLEDKNVTENGHYEPSEGYDFIGEFTVDVQPPLQDKTITENGTYSHDSGFYGLDEVTVDVQPELQTKTATENGTVVADSDYYGLSQVTVAVPDPDLVDATLTENGTYSHSGHDGYDEVTVNVQPPLQNKTILTNGTYTADEGYYGLGQITVDCPMPQPLVISGSASYLFSSSALPAFLATRLPISTSGITSADHMFYQTPVTEIPFDINFEYNPSSSVNMQYMFSNVSSLESLPNISRVRTQGLGMFVWNAYRLHEIPEQWGEQIDFSYMHNNAPYMDYIFTGCYSLRKLPSWHHEVWEKGSYNYQHQYQNCYTLDELVDIPVPQGYNPTSNMFNGTFSSCSRIKKANFYLNNDSPFVCTWKSQTIDLTSYVGYVQNRTYILNYNSGITADKQVTDAASYAALKNDPDWWTMDVAYSRYNHDSAVETINSLPDVSSGSSNSIKFKGASGSATDGGAINTLTADEIAVATAKGWTVTLA